MSSKRPTIHVAPTNDDPRSTVHAQSNVDRSTTHEDRSTTHPHAHASAHDEIEERQAYSGAFPHEKLDIYRVALEMAALAKELAEQIPRGHRNVADHLERAAPTPSSSTPREQIAEAQRRSASASLRAAGSAAKLQPLATSSLSSTSATLLAL